MGSPRLFHISEEPGIALFTPRPSPSFFEAITGDVVFSISERLLHNYLLPRDCPRVTYFANANSSVDDTRRFMSPGSADFVVAIEAKWYPVLVQTRLYCYEFPVETFVLLDATADYYISYKPVAPLSTREITDIPVELLKRNIELRIMPNLWALAEAIKGSSLSFSIIRMRNALPKTADAAR